MSIVEFVLPPRETPVKPRVAPVCCQLAAGGGGHVGQQGGAGDAHLGIRLADPRDRRGNVEILRAGLLDQRRQLRRSEAAPPILGRPGFRPARLGGAKLHRHLHLRPLIVGTEIAAAEQQRERQDAARQQANHRDAIDALATFISTMPTPNAAQSCHCQGLVTPCVGAWRAGSRCFAVGPISSFPRERPVGRLPGPLANAPLG